MSYKLATAFVEIVTKGMAAANRQFDQIGNRLGRLAGIASTFGLPLGIAAATAAAYRFVGAATESYDAEAKLRAIIASTGMAAKRTADDVLAMADAMQASTTFDDESIVNAASKLLTFKKVTEGTFDRTLKLAADLSAVGFGSLEGAAVQLGKALEDPVRGLGALRRAGVSFTEQEKKQIKSLVKSNQLLKAQEMILAAVAGQVGGVADAMAKTPSGKWKQIQNMIGNVGEDLGKRLLPLFVFIGEATLDAAKGVLAFADAVYGIGKALGDWPAKILAVVGLVAGLVTGVGLIPAGIFAAIVFAKDLGKAFQWAGEQLAHLVEWVQVLATQWRAALMIIQEGILLLATHLYDTITNSSAAAFGYAAGAAVKAFLPFIGWLSSSLFKTVMEFAMQLAKVAKLIPSLIKSGMTGNAKEVFKTLMGALKDGKGAIKDITKDAAAMGKDAGEQFGAGLHGKKAGIDLGLSDANKKRMENIKSMIDSLVAEKKKLEANRGKDFKLPDLQNKAKIKQEVEAAIVFPQGMTGLTDAWKNIQEAIVKAENPQEKMAAAMGNIEDLNDRMLDELIDINTKGINIANLGLA